MKFTIGTSLRSDNMYSHIEKRREYHRRYYAKNKDRLKEGKNRRWKRHYQAHKDDHANRELKRKFGITLEHKTQMLVSQDNRCVICKNMFKDSNDVCVDHDHTSNKIRQLLCRKCNVMLGYANDNVFILSEAINYLNKWREQ